MAVMSMLPAVTLVDLILAHAMLGILEMAELVVVCLFLYFYLSIYLLFLFVFVLIAESYLILDMLHKCSFSAILFFVAH